MIKTPLVLLTTTNSGTLLGFDSIFIRIRPNPDFFHYFGFRYTLAGFAAVDARVILAGFDSDNNGILDAAECSAWKEFVQGHMAQWGWNPSAEQQSAMQAAWNNAQSKFLKNSRDEIRQIL